MTEPMMIQATYLPSARILTLAALVCVAPVVATFWVAPGVWWAEYPGMLFHLSIFFLVPRLPAPVWAKAAGYGWAIIDTTVGAMVLNGVPREIAMPTRLGGHIFAGIWILGTSLSGSTSIRLIGCIAGIWVSAFTFVARFVPQAMLRPASLLVLVWLAVIAWQDGSTRRPSEQVKLRDQTPGAPRPRHLRKMLFGE
jgi:hypothetical protein